MTGRRYRSKNLQMSTEWWVVCPRLNRVTLVERPHRAHYLWSMMGRFTPRPPYPLERPPGNHFVWSLMDRSTPRPLYRVERPTGTHFVMKFNGQIHTTAAQPRTKATRYPFLIKLGGQIHTTVTLPRTKTTRYPLLINFYRQIHTSAALLRTKDHPVPTVYEVWWARQSAWIHRTKMFLPCQESKGRLPGLPARSLAMTLIRLFLSKASSFNL